MACLKEGNMIQTAHGVSVIICTYAEGRWKDLLGAISSVQQQTLSPREIIIVVDHSPGLLQQVREQVTGVIVIENIEARGLRGARNCGIAVAQSEIIAFLDDDAVAAPDWLAFLCEGYADTQVLGSGGKVTPSWEGDKPSWLPEEFYWVVGCSYRGMPQTVATVRNPIGANMSFRQEVFDTVGDFHSEIEQIGKRHAGGCEETELCIRARQRWPESVFLYLPEARVFHRVPDSRMTWRYFCSRCYREGLAKAIVAWYVGAKDSLASERSYTLRTLPQGIVRGLTDALFHYDFAGFARAGAIAVGLVVTTTGYLIGSVYLRVAKLKNAIARKEIIHYDSEVAAGVALEKERP
jgi:glycosyltransferase involved in cell wall biosynthesis